MPRLIRRRPDARGDGLPVLGGQLPGGRRDHVRRRAGHRPSTELIRPGACRYPAGDTARAGDRRGRNGPSGQTLALGGRLGARRRGGNLLSAPPGGLEADRDLRRGLHAQRRRSAYWAPDGRALPPGGIGGGVGAGSRPHVRAWPLAPDDSSRPGARHAASDPRDGVGRRARARPARRRGARAFDDPETVVMPHLVFLACGRKPGPV